MVRIFALFLAIALLATGVGGVAATAAPIDGDACACAASDGCDTAAMNGFSCQRCCIAATPVLPAVPSRMISFPILSPASSRILVALVTGIDPPPPRS